MFEDIIYSMQDALKGLDINDIYSLNPLTLAYIGDAVYEVYIRTVMISLNPNQSVHNLHVMSTAFVKAHAQCEIVHKITPMLTEEELNIIRRGRNSKSGYVPKNADVVEYRIATGFEALVGYLYLMGKMERLKEILSYAVSKGRES